MENLKTENGWVLMDDTPRLGHAGPRFYLVAAASAEEAMRLTRKKFKDAHLSLRGPAANSHLTRRNMQPGDVYAI